MREIIKTEKELRYNKGRKKREVNRGQPSERQNQLYRARDGAGELKDNGWKKKAKGEETSEATAHG